MSYLRPAKIVATMVRLIGGSLFWPEVADGPTCSCQSCRQAWRRTHSTDRVSPPATIGMGFRRLGSG